MAQLYFAEHEGTVSTTAPHPEKGQVCIQFKVDAHRVGTPDVAGCDLLQVAGITEAPQTCPQCATPAPTRASDPDDQ